MSLAAQPGKTPCEQIECRNAADLVCDGCKLEFCFDHVRSLPNGQHACDGCWPLIQVIWPSYEEAL